MLYCWILVFKLCILCSVHYLTREVGQMKNDNMESYTSTKLNKILSKEFRDDLDKIENDQLQILYGICLSGIYQAQCGSPMQNHFTTNTNEHKAFSAGYNSITNKISIPSAKELVWIDSDIIKRLFRQITINEISVVRHLNTDLFIIGTQIDIARISALCENAYADDHSIHTPIGSTKCSARCLIITFGE